MQKKFNRIILNLFDGSGASAAAGGAEGSGDGDATSSVAIKPEVRSRGREIGVSDDLMEDYQRAFYNGDDGGEDAKGADETENNNEGTESDENDLDAEFAELINGKYKDAFHKRVGNDVQARIDRATRDKAELETKLSKSDRVLQLLGEKYGTGDPDAIYDAIRADDELWRQQAIDKGMTSEEFIEGFDQKQAAAAQQQELESLRQYKQANELNMRLQQQAAKTREVYPDFDLEAEFQNPRFRAALDMVAAQNEESFKASGKNGEVFDITYAYELAHADEIRNNTIKRVSKATAAAVAQNIQANRNRPSENAARRTAPATKKSYDDMTDEEFAAHIDKVRRGETHIFR